MKRRIRVTQTHIDNGKPIMSRKCPAALALRDQGFPEAVVGSFGWWPNESIYEYDDEVYRKFSRRTERWIHAFDRNEPVKPFSFTIDVPDNG